MKKTFTFLTTIFLCIVCAAQLMASITSQQLLNKVKSGEASLKDFKANMTISEVNSRNLKKFDDSYAEIMRLKKATISFKTPNKLRWDGYADGIKIRYVQNGYERLVAGSGIKDKRNTKNSPGKRQDSLDLGFLTSQLWTDYNVTVMSTGTNGIAMVKFDPKTDDGNSKRKEIVWINTKTLAMTKLEHYGSDGVLKTKMVFNTHTNLTNGLPISSKITVYAGADKKLGVVEYKNLKTNTGLSDTVFAIK